MDEGRAVSLLKQFRILLRLSVRTEFQHRANLIQSLVGAVAFQSTQLFLIGVVLSVFGALGGWSAREMLLLVALRLSSHAVYAFFFRRVVDIDLVVNTGEYDRYLLRPAPPLLQLLMRQFNLQQIGDLVFAAVVLAVAVTHAPVTWGALNILFCIAAVIGGGLVEAAMQLLRGTLAFRVQNTLSLTHVIDNLFGTYGNFPMHMFGTAGAGFFTLVLPVAFAAWAPSAALLGRTDELWFPGWLAWCSPLVGVALMLLAVVVFNRSGRNYTSSGS